MTVPLFTEEQGRCMTLRVCIVDDDQDIRESLQILFEDSGAIVEDASRGDAALALLRAHPEPRVLLLDRIMPGMDGVAVLRALVQEPDIQQRTAVVFMTDRPEPPDTTLVELLNALDAIILPKPYDIDVLLGTVERAWQRLLARQ